MFGETMDTPPAGNRGSNCVVCGGLVVPEPCFVPLCFAVPVALPVPVIVPASEPVGVAELSSAVDVCAAVSPWPPDCENERLNFVDVAVSSCLLPSKGSISLRTALTGAQSDGHGKADDAAAKRVIDVRRSFGRIATDVCSRARSQEPSMPLWARQAERW